jgi:hypothetical protein
MRTLTYYDCQFHIGQDIYINKIYFGTVLGVDRRSEGRLLLYNGTFNFDCPLLPTMQFKLRPFESLTDEEMLFIANIFDNSVKWTIERTPKEAEFNGSLLKGSSHIDYLKISFDTETISSLIGKEFFRLHSSVEKLVFKYLLLRGFDVYDLESENLAFYE